MKTVIKVMLGMLLAGILLLVGCVVLVGGAANEVDKSIKKEQNTRAITNKQARSVHLGTKKSNVIAQFGKPKSTQESENEGIGKDSCIYYNIKGGEVLDQWQFCFNNKKKLTAKNRL